ncbi:helix-turn-helix domain-containing protein [Streptomyces sp. NBC_00433]
MSTDNTPTDTASPLMNNKEAARYLKRTPNALRILRHRRRGPKSFIKDGRIWYFSADLDAWLNEAAQADSRFNPDLDPTRVPAQTRGSRAA